MSAKIKPPKNRKQNLIYRQEIREWALKSASNRKYLLDRCAEDFFFWLETFAFVMEPRPEKDSEQTSKIFPFIPWRHQIPMMNMILEALGFMDIGIEKSRGEGATWTCLMIFLWRWLFVPGDVFGIVSRNELAADNPRDPDSLGYKLDWELKMLPTWMSGRKDEDYYRNISKHTWFNTRNDSSITAYAATGELASGGRKTAFLMDEFAKFERGEDEHAMAATEPVTECRLLVSTYNGTDGAYYRCMKEPSSMVRITLDWKDNPIRNRSLFQIDREGGKLLKPGERSQATTPQYAEEFFRDHLPILVKRGFNVDDEHRIWSPWYVARCLRPNMTPRFVAQEYDRDPEGVDSKFFSGALISKCIKSAREPVVQGDFNFDPHDLSFESFKKMRLGRLKLWRNLRSGDVLPPAKYIVGVDVASGQGGDMSSNSAISIIDRSTGEKVGEFADPNTEPHALADLSIALCRWLLDERGEPAFLIWERNGYGGSFRNRILDSSFRNFYYQTILDTSSKKKTKKPGWWSNKESKRDLLTKYRWALQEGFFHNPSELALRECLCYLHEKGDKIVFSSGLSDIEDPASSAESHGDRVIADALANYAMEELNGGPPPEVETSIKRHQYMNPPINSFRYRQMERQKADRAAKKDWW